MSVIERVNEIERLIAEGRINAAQVFTQMKQLIPTSCNNGQDCEYCEPEHGCKAPASGEVVAEVVHIGRGQAHETIQHGEALVELTDCKYKLKVGDLLYTNPPAKVPEMNWKPSELDYDHSIHTNPDAKAWVDFFMATFPSCGADPETMHGWFANAMMAMYDHLKNTTPTPATTSETEWVKCHAETAAIALEALHFYAAERFKGFGDDPEPYEHHLAQQAISELQELLPTPPQEQ